jgi:ABC-type multidrug transport system fused ATPase/permease subunit
MRDIYALLGLLYRLQTRRQRSTFLLTVILLILAGYLEYLVITLVGPLVSNVSSGGSGVAEMALLLIVLSLLTAVVRVLQIHIGHSYVYGLGHMFSCETLGNALNADYIELKRSHSAALLKRFEMINIAVNSVLTPLLILLASSITALAIGISLILADVRVAVIGLGGLTAFYLIAALMSRKALLRNAALFNRAQGERIFLIREAMSGYRELKIGALIGDYQQRFNAVDQNLRHSQVRNLVLGASPRFVLEALAFTSVALVVYWASRQVGGTGAALLSTLATFALGAQRLLPHAQSIYSSISSIVGHHSMIAELRKPLFEARQRSAQPDTAVEEMFLSNEGEILLTGLGFSYPNALQPTLSNINLEISRGSRIALVGSSGSGKTTFLELFCGLLTPTQGTISVNGQEIRGGKLDLWQRQIAYVPQNPFLVSGSLRDNVLLGGNNKELSDFEIITALSAVGLGDWLAHLVDGLAHDVGENGSNLSGGQRQRLAIARALAGGKSILVLDEITSNLDAQNESAILELILTLPRNFTVICSLHKAQVLDRFDRVLTFGAKDSGCSEMVEKI